MFVLLKRLKIRKLSNNHKSDDKVGYDHKFNLVQKENNVYLDGQLY